MIAGDRGSLAPQHGPARDEALIAEKRGLARRNSQAREVRRDRGTPRRRYGYYLMTEFRAQNAKKAAGSLMVVSDTDSRGPGSSGPSMGESGILFGSARRPDQRAAVSGAITPSPSHSAICFLIASAAVASGLSSRNWRKCDAEGWNFPRFA